MTTWSSIGGFSDIAVVHPAVTLPNKMRVIDAMAAVQANWLRTICAWNYITKARDPGPAVAAPPSYGFSPNVYTPPTTLNRDWSSLDGCVNEVLRRIPGIRPQLIIGQGKPKWSGFVGAPKFTDYGDFCVEVVNRYGPGGLGIAPDLRSAGRCVMDFEIWNEQNNKGFWTWGNVDPKGYVAMISDAYTKIKAAKPTVTVVFGSYQHVPHTGPWYGYGWMTQPEIDWWQECVDNGLGNVFDVVGAHPYSLGDYEYGLGPLEPSLTASDAWLQFQSIRDLVVANGWGGKPWRITEIGYPTSMCTEAQQVQYHQESMAFMDGFPFVEAYMIYDCLDDGADRTAKDQSLGSMYNDFTPKQLYFFLQAQNGVVIQPPPMHATANTATHTLRKDTTVHAPPMTATADVVAPRVLANVLIAPTFTATAALPAPTVHMSTALTAPRMTATAAWPDCFVIVDNPPPISNVKINFSGPGIMANTTGASTGGNYHIPTGLLDPYLLVGVVFSHTFQIGYAGLTITCTIGGVPMTMLGATDIGNFKEGSVHWFGLANPPTGSSVALFVGATGVTIRGILVNPVLLEGALGVGDVVTNKSSNFWTVSADIESGVNDRVFLLVGGAKQVTTCTADILYNNGDLAIGGQGSFFMMAAAPSDGDGSTNITATQGSSAYGMVGIQMLFDPALNVINMHPLPMMATGSFSVPVPHAGQSVTAVHFPATAAFAVPTVSINYNVTAVPFTATAAAAAPVVHSNVTITAVPMTATASAAAPVVSSSASVTGVHFAATAAMPAPTVTSGYVEVAPAFAATAAMPAPAVSASSAVTALPFTATAAMPAPLVGAVLAITAPPMTATAAAAAPTVSATVSITALPFTATAAAAAPVVSATRNPTVTAVPFTATASAAAPVASTSGSITAVAFAATAAAAAPAVSTNYSVTGVAMAATAAMAAPVVSTSGPITVNAVVFPATAAMAAPTVIITPKTLLPVRTGMSTLRTATTAFGGTYVPQTNDIIYFFVRAGNAGATITVPSGWLNALPAGGNTTVSNASGVTVCAIYRAVTGTEVTNGTTTYTATNLWDSTQTGACYGVVVRGANPSAPIDDSESLTGASSTTHQLPGLTGVNLSTGSLVIPGVASTGSGLYTDPAGETLLVKNTSGQNQGAIYQQNAIAAAGVDIAAVNISSNSSSSYAGISTAFAGLAA